MEKEMGKGKSIVRRETEPNDVTQESWLKLYRRETEKNEVIRELGLKLYRKSGYQNK